MAKQGTKIEQFVHDFNLLKKTLIEEKQKTTKFQSEINGLKKDLIFQKEVSENLQKVLAMTRQNPQNSKNAKSFFNNLFSINQLTGEEEEEKTKRDLQMKDNIIQKLTLENSSLKEQISSLQREKDFSAHKLKEQMIEYEKLKEIHSNEIQEIHEQYENHDRILVEETTKIESMSLIIKKLEQEKIEHEKMINLLMNDISNKAQGLELLFKEENELLEEIEELKQQNTTLKNNNEKFIRTLEEIIPITKKSIFKGIRMISRNLKKGVEITYGENNKSITIKEENEESKVIPLEHISEMKKIESNTIRFKVKTNDNEEEYLIEFPEKYLSFIMKYYREGKIKQQFIHNLLITYPISDIFV